MCLLHFSGINKRLLIYMSNDTHWHSLLGIKHAKQATNLRKNAIISKTVEIDPVIPEYN